MKILILLLRLLFGAIFVWSGMAKLKDPISFADAVRNFQIVGDPIAPLLALFIPWVELLSGLAVMTWWRNFGRGGALILLTSLVIFTLAILISWIRGLDVSCGCFGGTKTVRYPWKIGQNLLLLGMGILVLLVKREGWHRRGTAS